MKITGTRSYIKVEIDGKVLKITGELTTTPAFYADTNSIKSWEPPYHKTAITEKEKAELIRQISEESKKSNFPVIFD